jgi:tripartite-type tricarboxylate transporter receptor subunit TctC
MFAPAGAPRDILTRVNRELVRALATNDVKEKLKAQGVDPVGSTPEELVAHQKRETAKWGKVIREQGIKFE